MIGVHGHIAQKAVVKGGRAGTSMSQIFRESVDMAPIQIKGQKANCRYPTSKWRYSAAAGMYLFEFLIYQRMFALPHRTLSVCNLS